MRDSCNLSQAKFLTFHIRILLQESQRAVGRQPAGPRGGVPAQRGRPLPRLCPLLRTILLRLFWQVHSSLFIFVTGTAHSCEKSTCPQKSQNLSLSDPCQLYFTFRAFYLQFCSKLHEVSSDRQGILSLCALFENLVSFDISLILNLNLSYSGV